MASAEPVVADSGQERTRSGGAAERLERESPKRIGCYPARLTDSGKLCQMPSTLSRRSNFRSRAACGVVVALVLALEAAGCAGNPFGRGRPSRKEAIAHCIEMIPAESALYADHFSACMEQQGWVYSSSGS